MVKQRSKTVQHRASDPYTIPTSILPPDSSPTKVTANYPEQNLEIVMEEQYLNYMNANDTHSSITKDSILKAKLCLHGALMPDESIEEIEFSCVVGQETKIHALLLRIVNDINLKEKIIKMVSFLYQVRVLQV